MNSFKSNSVSVIFLTDFFSDRQGGHQRHLGPYHMAGVLRNRGLKVRVLDFIYSIPEKFINLWIEKYVSSDTKIVGISSTFLRADSPPFYPDPEKDRITAILKKIRDRNPEIKIVQGAPLVFYKHPWVEKVFDGSNVENKFLDYLRSECSIDVQSDYEFNSESIQFSEDDFVLQHESIPMEISRGCIFSCKFCGFAGRGKKKNDAIKSFEVLRLQMEEHHKKFGLKNYYLADDTFNESVEKVTNFHNMVQSLSFRPNFICYARLDLIWAFPQMLDLLYRSGVRFMVLGIETLNTKAGAIVGKGLGKKRVQETLERIRSKYPEIYLSSGFIIGLPEESLQSCIETNQWLLETKLLDTWVFAPLRIDNVTKDPFKSEFSKNIEQYGYERIHYSDWKRPDLDSKTCEETAVNLNRSNASFIGPSPWSLFNALRIHDVEKLRHLKSTEYEKYLDKDKLNAYLEKLTADIHAKG